MNVPVYFTDLDAPPVSVYPQGTPGAVPVDVYPEMDYPIGTTFPVHEWPQGTSGAWPIQIINDYSGTDTTVSGVPPLTLAAALAKNIKSLKQYGLCTQAATPTPSAPMDIVCNNGTLKMVDDELPVGYKRLLDITTSGNLRYVSNVHITGADTLRFTYKSSPGNLLGSYHDTDADDNYSYYPTTSTTAKYARYNGQTGGSSSATGTEYTIEMSPTGVTGTRNPSSFTPATFTTSIPFCIFATSPTGSAISSATIYGSIEISGSQSVKFIPCERMSDSAIGYYDTLHREFIEVTGTGVPSTSGYDNSHLTLGIVGTPEVLSVAGQTASVQNLYAVGDYKDVQDVISGAVTRKTGVTIFDGTETWTKSGTYAGSFYVDNVPSTRALVSVAICSHGFTTPTLTAYSAAGVGAMFLSPVSRRLNYKYDDDTASVADFKSWLADQYAAGTPVIVLYPLADEVTESVTPQPLQTVEGDNTVSVSAEVSGMTLEAVYVAASS